MGARQSTDVVVWGRLPPPVGGVTRSVAAMVDGLRSRGLNVAVVDLRRPQVKRLLKVFASTHGISIYHISGPSSLLRFWPAIAVDRRRKVLFLHAAEGNTTNVVRFPWWFKRIASRFAKIWVTNELLAKHVRREVGFDVSVASPFSGPVEKGVKAPVGSAGSMHCVTFMHNGHELYNAFLAANSVARMRDCGLDASLTVVSYGSMPTAGVWSAMEEHSSEISWLSLVANTDGRGAEPYLAEADVLLRLTTTDGDSMVLREALSLGLRVVASSEVPRPRGVELVELTIESVSRGIMYGGKVSNGAGLGESILEEFLNWHGRP